MLEPLVPDLAALAHTVAIVANAEGALVLEWRVGDIEVTGELGCRPRTVHVLGQRRHGQACQP